MERTDTSFRELHDPEHHNDISILTTIEPPINMVTSFVLDFMHLCCIGVMKRLLVQIWSQGKLNVRLSRRMRVELSRRLVCLKPHIPCEFQRKPRSLEFVHHWKATEFRFFLLYCGPVVLKNILNSIQYQHFLLLHIACRVLCDEKMAQKFSALAKTYLERFFELLPILYGPETQVLNMHHLIHLADDVENMECSLSEISAFIFENYLGKLKKLVRTPNQPLAKICRRLHEYRYLENKKSIIPPSFTILKEISSDDARVFVSMIEYKQFRLTHKAPNNVTILQDKTIFTIKSIFWFRESPQNIFVKGYKWSMQQPIFTLPTSSNKLKIYELKKRQRYMSTYPLQFVQQKLVNLLLNMKLNGKKRIFVIPLLHH